MRATLLLLAMLAGCGGDASECVKCDNGSPTEATPGRPTEKQP